MRLLDWLLYLAAAAAALGVVAFVYRRREMQVPGRGVLIALRWLVLAVLLLVVFDPRLPAASAIGGGRTLVLLDGSLSMQLPAGAGTGEAATRWRRALDEVRREGAREVLLFGGAPRTVPADSLAALTPEAGSSRLLPALQAASEAGVSRVVVVTDGGIEDAAEVARWLPRLGLDLEPRSVAPGAAPADRALAEVDAPRWAEAGKPVEVRASVAASAATAESVTVVIRREGRVVAQGRAGAPAPGRLSPVTLSFTPEAPAGGGTIRYEAAIAAPGDAVDADDARTFYVLVSDRPPGVAVVSFEPDWEPRFLMPVLDEALGLPMRGFLRTRPGEYVTLGAGLAAGRRAPEEEVRQAATQADLLVVHGLGADAPAWAVDAARRLPRVLVFPGVPAPQLGLPVQIPPPVGGEWYVSAGVPASPLAPLLAQIQTEAVAPLTALHPVQPAAGTWAPLLASRGGRGGATAPVAIGGGGARRWVVALGDGYWQWAFRGGNGREVYRRLWGSVAGWLVQDRPTMAGAAIRPAERTIPRGQPVRWIAPGVAADSIAIRVAAEAGGAASDTTIRASRGDTAVSRPLPPGHYRYRAQAFAGGRPATSAEGVFTVERYSPEFVRATVAPAAFRGEGAPLSAAAFARRGAPLHASPIPYVLIVLLLAAEWILRRRWGLR